MKKKVKNSNMQARAVFECAALANVRYISGDRNAKKSGHLSLTTGAEAKLLGGSTEYNGSSVAVLSSGIYSDHISVNNSATSLTRVVYSKDFTGEGTTAELYGHGTHVSDIIAPSNAVSAGAYRGIVANATLVNLKVLVTNGTGEMSSRTPRIFDSHRDSFESDQTRVDIRWEGMSETAL